MSFVVVDLGASSTRFVSNSGKFRNLSNFVYFDENMSPERTFTPVEYQSINPNDPYSSLELIVYKKGDAELNEKTRSKMFPMHFLMDIMGKRSGLPYKCPKAGTVKALQRVNYASVITSIVLSKIEDKLNDDVIDLYIALPPSEINKWRAFIKSEIIGEFVVEMPKYKNGVTINLNIRSLEIYSEGVMAVHSFFWDSKYQDIPEHAKYQNKGTNILSIDIGHSTADLVMFNGSSALEYTYYTIHSGGNMIISEINEMLASQAMGLASDDSISIALSEGRIKAGKNYIDVSAPILAAKKNLANKIIAEIPGYLNNKGIQAYNIDLIIVSGGGGIPTGYTDPETKEFIVTAPSVLDLMLEQLQSMATGADIVVNGNEPRNANVLGMYNIAHYNALKEQGLIK